MRRPDPVPLADVDLSDLDAFARDEGWAMLDTLRAQDPVHWNPETDGSGFWAVTRYDDIRAVDRDPDTFTSTDYVNLEEVDPEWKDRRRSMLETDGVRHLALRRLIQREFSAGSLNRKYEDFLRGLTRETVDRALSAPEFDFVDAVAADFPIQVLVRLLDAPVADTAQLIDWGNQMIGNTDPEYSDNLLYDPNSEQYKHLPFRTPAALDVFAYGRELARQRKGGDGTDLVSQLVNRTPEDGEPLSATDFDNYFLLLVVAGNETTRQAISQTMLALIQHPDQLRRLQRHPELIPHAVEEFLRWASPVYHFRRTATRDVELGGKQIRRGDKVVMWFASGNRDDAAFPDPYELDVTRSNVEHVTFGKGSPHTCLGNSLARMEIRLMFEELIPRLAEIELAGEVTRVRSNFVNGIKKFPVRARAAEPSTGGDTRPSPGRAKTQPARTVVREHEAELRVAAAETVADEVVALSLESPDGSDLPSWSPGAHLDLILGDDVVRQYSLCGSPAEADRWQVAVLRTPESRGGSRGVHDQLRAGASVRVRGPRNHFPLVRSPRYLFIAGGIGITPLRSMIAQAEAAGADWRLVYGGRRRSSMAFADELAADGGERVSLQPRDEGGRIDLPALLGTPQPDTLVYCCGPERLLSAVELACASWPAGSLHVERFSAKALPDGTVNDSFELVLAQTGVSVTVPPDRSVFDVAQQAGANVLGSCMEGICGTCETEVIEGDVEHRDSVLNAQERQAGEYMMICVSRCRSGRLVLDA